MDNLLNFSNIEQQEEEKSSLTSVYNGTYLSNTNITSDTVSHIDLKQSQSDQLFQRIISDLNVYVIPAIIIIGVIGNTISFLVYILTPHLCRQSSSVYLAFLAAVDNGVLLSLFVVWIGWVGVHIFHKNGWCQTIQYCMYVCSFLSAWTVVSFTVERWIVVFHPLRRHELCTRKRSVIVMVSLTVFSLGFYSFSLWKMEIKTSESGREFCASSGKYQAFLKVIMRIDTILTVIVPIVTIIIMNTGIGIKICRYTNSKKQIPIGQYSAGACEDQLSNISAIKSNYGGPGDSIDLSTRNTPRHSSMLLALGQQVNKPPRSWRLMTRRHHTQLRITRALLMVSTMFVLLNLPSSAFRVHALVLTLRNERYDIPINEYVWQELLRFLYYINFSSNFFLYSACSRNFRHALKRLLRRAQHKIRNLSSQRCSLIYNLLFLKRDDTIQ